MKGRKPQKLVIVFSTLLFSVILCGAILGVLVYSNPSHYSDDIIKKYASKIKTPKSIDAVIGMEGFSLKTDSRDNDAVVSYTSDNPDVVKVDENGVLHIEGKGSAVITAFTNGDLFHGPAYSKTIVNVSELSAPKITRSKPGVRNTEIGWEKVKHADGYYINEYDSADKLIDTVKVSAKDNYAEFPDKAIGSTYSYEVIAFTEVGGNEFKGKPSEKVTETARDALIGQARNDEHKKTRGGSAGDQTGKEVAISGWSHGSSWNHWSYVARFKDPEKARIAADAMEAACNNNHVGYDQSNRTSLYNVAKAANWDIENITTNCECSCSPLVSVCINAAGVSVPAGWWTANKSMKAAMQATGEFEFYTDSSYTASTKNLKRGDILVTTGRHAGMVL